MRAFHRWFGPLSALLLIFIAATGLALQIDLWASGNPPPSRPPTDVTAPALEMPSDAEIAAMVVRSLSAAREAQPDLAVSTIEMRFSGQDVRATIGPGGPNGVMVNARTGEATTPVPKRADYHYVLQDLHAGYFAGTAGRIISAFAAISLLVLGVSGLFVYVGMFVRRTRNGQRNLFW